MHELSGCGQAPPFIAKILSLALAKKILAEKYNGPKLK